MTTETKKTSQSVSQNGPGVNFADARKKFKEVVLYVAQKLKDDPHHGAIKRNKICFYADFLAYQKWGAPITGVEYRRYERGPAPSCWNEIRKELERNGEAVIEQVPTETGKVEHVLVPKREPDLSLLTEEDLAMINEVALAFFGRTGREVSDISHRFTGWRLAGLGEEIPYYTSLLRDQQRELTATEEAFGRQVAKQLTERYSPATP